MPIAAHLAFNSNLLVSFESSSSKALPWHPLILKHGGIRVCTSRTCRREVLAPRSFAVCRMIQRRPALVNSIHSGQKLWLWTASWSRWCWLLTQPNTAAWGKTLQWCKRVGAVSECAAIAHPPLHIEYQHSTTIILIRHTHSSRGYTILWQQCFHATRPPGPGCCSVDGS